jgi:galactose-1-phosphate uridylyltransferase
MSTRCNVIVRDKHNAIQLYRHWDGYPEAIIPDLKVALIFAWTLPRMEASDYAAAIVKSWKGEKGGHIYIDGDACIPETLHGDIDYYYIIQPNKSVGKWEVLCYSPDHKQLWKGFVGDDYRIEVIKPTPEERLKKIADIIECVDCRCLAADGPVSSTLEEMTQEEISEIYKLAKGA